jgi:hypothetical protein
MRQALAQVTQRELVSLVVKTRQRRPNPLVAERVAELGGERAAEVSSALAIQRFFMKIITLGTPHGSNWFLSYSRGCILTPFSSCFLFVLSCTRF